MKSLIAIAIVLTALNIEAYAQSGWFTQESGTNLYLTSVYFVNSNTGWVVGDYGILIKTTNGGTNWFQQSSNAGNKLMSVQFTNENTGWTTGYAATMRKTTNSGENWLTQSIGPAWLPWSLHFVDENNGWIACEFGIIMHTTNGGTDWLEQVSGTGEDLYSVRFANNSTGWAVGGGGTILRTTNGGTNWVTQSSGTGYQLRTVFCIDINTAWTVGWFGTILKTTDGGTNWTAQSSGIGNHLRSVYFTDNITGWVVGWDGIICSTTSGGANWNVQPSGTSSLLWSVYFTDVSTGWAVGTLGILKTTTGGNQFPEAFCGPGPHFVDFCSAGIDSLDIAHNCETKAMIRMSLDTSDNCNVPSMPLPVFTGPTIVRRSDPKDTSGRFPGVAQLDGHNDIIETEFVSMDLRAFVASNGDTAFFRIRAGQGNAVGTCGTSLRPTFGYIHESPLYNYSAESFFDVFLELCIEDPNGVIGPPNPQYYLYNQEPVRMRATIDQIPPKCGIDPNTNEYYTVYMPDQNTCAKLYASCIPGVSNPPIAKVVHVEHALPVELVSFTATQNGNDVDLTWTTSAEKNNYGFSMERNSGSAWNEIGFVAGKGTVNTPSHYEFTDRKLSSGILRYRLKQIDFNGNFEYFDLSEAVAIGVPDEFSLEQNYPNPFNPVTTIAFGIPQAGNVKLKVFDMSGREIKTLINEFKDAGYYTAKFDASGIASGAYVYRLAVSPSNPIESGNFVSVKKMILLK
jgi:photosystem II stability/assembly factor-like uncharacterized protein